MPLSSRRCSMRKPLPWAEASTTWVASCSPRRRFPASRPVRIQGRLRQAQPYPPTRIAAMIKFKGVLTRTPQGGGGTLVPIPRDVQAKLGLKGMPKIQAVIEGTPYRGSLMPMGDGTYCLGVLKSIQAAAGVGVGDRITVLIELDTEPRTVEAPPDLAAVLARDKKAAAAWEKLSYTNKKEMARSLEESKQSETRKRRLAAALEKLRA